MDEQSRLRGHCTQAGCEAAKTGTCIENLRMEECTHFVIARGVETDGTKAKVDAAEITEELVSIGPGATLDVAQADAFLRARPATLVAFIGIPDAGKTTLISTMYELARRRLMA